MNKHLNTLAGKKQKNNCSFDQNGNKSRNRYKKFKLSTKLRFYISNYLPICSVHIMLQFIQYKCIIKSFNALRPLITSIWYKADMLSNFKVWKHHQMKIKIKQEKPGQERYLRISWAKQTPIIDVSWSNQSCTIINNHDFTMHIDLQRQKNI